MFFSILIPAYNKDRYIPRCLESVFAQGFDDYEIIFVDDGSTDSTLSKALLYNDERVVLIHTDNRGVSSARNTAIAASSGQYLIFLDADDAFAPDYLQRVYDDILSNNCPDMVIGGLLKISSKETKRVLPSFCGNYDSKSYRTCFMYDMINNEGLPGYIANKVVSRGFVSAHSLSFNPDLKMAEDLDFWVDCYRYAESIVVSDNDGYFYYTGMPGSLIQDRNVDYISQLYIWNKVRDYASSSDLDVIHYFDMRFSGYAVSAFNELRDVSKENVSVLLHSIEEHHNRTHYQFIKCGQPLSFLITLGSVNLIYYYLRFRKFVHDKRNHPCL